jgi:dynein heavy chain
LKIDVGSQYIKAGVKNQPVMFLMTDAQVPQEEFLVLINDLLASGEIPGLFADDEIEEIINGVRNEVCCPRSCRF